MDMVRAAIQVTSVEQLQHAPPERLACSASLCITAAGDMTDEARVLEFNRACINTTSRPIRRLIIDVADVSRSDTKLIAVLISLYTNCRRKRIELELRLSSGIINWLGIYDLTWLAEICAPNGEL